MNILFFQPTFGYDGGIDQLSADIASGLSENHSVRMLSVYAPERKNDGVFIDSFCSNLSANPFLKIYALFERAFLLKKFSMLHKPDVIIVSGEGCIISAALSNLIFGLRTPFIAWMHQGTGKTGIIYNVAMRVSLYRMNKIIAVSKGIYKTLYAYLDKVKLIENCTDFERNEQKASEKVPEEMMHLLNDPRKKYFTASRLIPIKRVLELIQIWSSTKGNDNKNMLLVAGEGEQRQEIKSYIEKNELSEKVFLLGSVKNIFPLLKRAECYLSAAEYEPFGLSILEALSVGCPVISTDCPYGPREIVMGEVYDSSSNFSYPLKTTNGILVNNDLSDFGRALTNFDERLYNKGVIMQSVRRYDLSAVLNKWNTFLNNFDNKV